MAQFKALADFLDHLTNDIGIPGCSVAVYKEHTPLFKYSSGYADRESNIKMCGNELFNLYSTSKVITCACALTLLEKGKFLLSDPLCEYIPEYADMNILVKADNGQTTLVKAKNKIKVCDLFTMSAGLNYNLQSDSIKNALAKCESRSTTDIVRAIAGEPLSFEPGTRWQYSLCHDVLGGFIEIVSGKSFGQYLNEAILEPCGMSSTGFDIGKLDSSRLAKQYRFDYSKKRAFPESGNIYKLSDAYESGGAGLISCVDDYILFADAMANGGVASNGNRILSRYTIDLMRTNHLDSIALADLNWSVLSGYGYGLGVRTMMHREKGGIIGSVGEFGWGGAAGAYAMIDPENKLSVFYAQHMLNNLEPYVHPRIRNIVYSELGE